MRYALISACLFIFGFLSAYPVYGQIQINEFSSAGSDDWIELYNPTDEDISLDGLLLRDSSESNNNKKELQGTVPARGFFVIDWDKLNQDIDSIRIIGGKVPVAPVNYGVTDLPAPGSGQSVGRAQDGADSWVIFSIGTKGLSNGNAQVYFPPTQTPTKTLAPTKAPTATKVPTMAKDPTSTKVPTSTDVPTGTNTPTDFIEEESDQESATDEAVLGNSNIVDESGNKSSNKSTLHKLDAADNITGGVMFISSSVLLLSACGILLFRKYRKV